MAEQHGVPGAPLVAFVHGSLDRSGAFLKVQRHLREMTVLRYDRRGYAKSISLGPATSFDVQVDDLALVLADRPAIICGHSLGGVIALAVAERYPDLVRSVVAFEAPMPWTAWWPTTTAGGAALEEGDEAGAAERFMRRLLGDARWNALPEATREQRRAEGPALLADMVSIRPPAPAPYRLDRIHCPVVAAYGSKSSLHHRESARQLAAAVAGAELAVVDGSEHAVHLTHPGELAALVRRAVQMAGPRGNRPSHP